MNNFLRWLGRASQTLFGFLWTILQEVGRGLGRLCFLILEGIGHGIASALRVAAPYLIGSGVLWYVFTYQPELFNGILTLAIMAFGLRLIVGKTFGRRNRK